MSRFYQYAGKILMCGCGGIVLGLIAAHVSASIPVGWWVSLLCLLSSALLMHAAIGLFRLRELTIPAIWWISYVAVVVLPAHLVALEHPGRPAGVFLLAVQSALLTVPSGILLASWLLGFRRSDVRRYFHRAIQSERAERQKFLVCVLFALLMLALTAKYFAEAPAIPLFHLLRNPGDYSGTALLREEAWKLLDSSLVYWYDVLRRVYYPLLISIALGFWLESRRTRWVVLLGVMASVGLLFAAAATAKMPVAAMALITVLFLFLYKGGRLPMVGVLAGVAAVFAFPAWSLVIGVRESGIGFWRILRMLFMRLAQAPAEMLYYYFEIFPGDTGFLVGRTIGKSAWLTGTPYFDVENYVYGYIFPGQLEYGAASAPFLGTLYADFGPFGVVLGAVLAGLLMQSVQVWLMRRPKTVIHLAAYASLAWAFTMTNLQSLAVSLLSGGVFFVIAFLMILETVGRMLVMISGNPAKSARPAEAVRA